MLLQQGADWRTCFISTHNMSIYLDHAATSPMTQAVRDAYLNALDIVGNPASTHAHGQRATDLLEQARETISGWLGTQPALVTLTGGGTESINLALKGMYWAATRQNPQRNVLLVAEGEHHATIEAVNWLAEHQGAHLHWLPIDADGVLQPETLAAAIEQYEPNRIALASFLWANNEVGSILPVQQLTEIARSAGVPTHVDAVAALGGVRIDFTASGASALSVSAHKIGGPVGVGALLIARDTRIDQLHHGGSQQRARAGTQNVAGALAFAAALSETYRSGYEKRIAHMQEMRDLLVRNVTAAAVGATYRGSQHRLPGNAHFTFEHTQGDSLVYLLDEHDISASMGSACAAGVAEVSHVLLSMGLSHEDAIGSLRFTLSADTTAKEVEEVVRVLPEVVRRARAAGRTSL